MKTWWWFTLVAPSDIGFVRFDEGWFNPGMIKQEFSFTINTFSRGKITKRYQKIMKRYQSAVSHYPEKLNHKLWHFLSFRSLPCVICVLKVYACHPCECVKLRHVAGLFWTHDDDCLLLDSSLIKFLWLSLCWWVIQRHVPKAISFIHVNPLISVFFKTPDPVKLFWKS